MFGRGNITKGVRFCGCFLVRVVAGCAFSRGIFLDRDGCRSENRIFSIAQSPYSIVALKADEIAI
jgi:hypothetical protein